MLQILFIASLLLFPNAKAELQEVSDGDLADVTGQAMIVANKIQGQAGSGLTFYRMMLDAELGMNMNIDHLQLGCGGYNEIVRANSCDLDLEYMSLMGRGAGQTSADGMTIAGVAPVPDGSNPLSVFKLIRPYLEFAVKNDSNSSAREFAGLKIGSQLVDGYLSLGRYINPSYSVSDGCTQAKDLACHQGANSLSGYMYAHMQGEVWGCITSWLALDYACPTNKRLGEIDSSLGLSGTRMNTLTVMNLPVTLKATGIMSLLNGLTLTGNIIEDTRYMHGLMVDPSLPQYAQDDFFMSFQRERIRWPTKNACSGWCYASIANPGWWMNLPAAEMTGLRSDNNEIPLSGLFGLTMTNVDLGQRPADNCYGSLTFC